VICPACAHDPMENDVAGFSCPECSLSGDGACMAVIKADKLMLESERAENAMLRREIRRLACGDYHVRDDGCAVACGLPDGHGGPCVEKECSRVLEMLDDAGGPHAC
jgi:hypothetical protein